jgi:hypothetical protein
VAIWGSKKYFSWLKSTGGTRRCRAKAADKFYS